MSLRNKSLAGTLQLIWGSRASRPHWSVSRRPDRVSQSRTVWFGISVRCCHRRDADGSDRDGRDPHSELHHSGLDCLGGHQSDFSIRLHKSVFDLLDGLQALRSARRFEDFLLIHPQLIHPVPQQFAVSNDHN